MKWSNYPECNVKESLPATKAKHQNHKNDFLDNKPFTANNTYSTCAGRSCLILVVVSLSMQVCDKIKAMLVN
jgi:hypothetical protein